MIQGVLRLKLALRRSPLMTTDQKLPNLVQREAVTYKRFDPHSATPFLNKSVSEETRRAYRRAVADFFQFVGGKYRMLFFQVSARPVVQEFRHIRLN
jgi:hypothetical protein